MRIIILFTILSLYLIPINSWCPCCDIDDYSENAMDCGQLDYCLDHHADMPYDIIKAMQGTKSTFIKAKRNKQVDCDVNQPYYKSCGGSGGIEDALFHATFAGILGSEIHTDTWGRGKGKAKSLTSGYTNSREGCHGVNLDSKMDVNSNNKGADTFYKLVRTKCTLRIGYIFGSKCVARKEYPPSNSKIYNYIWKNLIPKAKLVTNGNVQKYINRGQLVYKKAFTRGTWKTGSWSSCKKSRMRRTVECKVRNNRVGEIYCIADGGKSKPRTSKFCRSSSRRSRRSRVSCMNANATVMTPEKSIQMWEVKVGDEIMVAQSNGTIDYDTVFSIASNTTSDGGNTKYEYLTFNTDAGLEVSLTPDHYLHAGPTCCTELSLVKASDIKIGDFIWADASVAYLNTTSTNSSESGVSSVKDENVKGEKGIRQVKVISIIEEELVGAYNPFMLANAPFVSPIVDSVICSSFTGAMSLIEKYGADSADKVMNSLREIYREDITVLQQLSKENHVVQTDIGVDLQDITTDCVNDMDICTLEYVTQRTAQVFEEAKIILSSESIDACVRGVNKVIDRSTVRRLMASRIVNNNSSWVNAAKLAFNDNTPIINNYDDFVKITGAEIYNVAQDICDSKHCNGYVIHPIIIVGIILLVGSVLIITGYKYLGYLRDKNQKRMNIDHIEMI